MTTYSYTGAQQSTTLSAGIYKFECWGGEGNTGYNAENKAAGGKGGYATGVVTLLENTLVYIYVGGGYTGQVDRYTGGWNGGGSGELFGTVKGGGGGGASDIRSSGSALENRIIVAGGGGGGSGYYPEYPGGYGGGLVGGDATSGTGGTQEAGGSVGGTLGIGGNGGAGYGQAGGGGGYYGGGGAAVSDYYAGGGGSSYLGTLINSSTTEDIREGNGEIIITKQVFLTPVWFMYT